MESDYTSMESFPEQVIVLIAGMISDVTDLVSLTCVSRRFYNLSNDLKFQGRYMYHDRSLAN